MSAYHDPQEAGYPCKGTRFSRMSEASRAGRNVYRCVEGHFHAWVTWDDIRDGYARARVYLDSDGEYADPFAPSRLEDAMAEADEWAGAAVHPEPTVSDDAYFVTAGRPNDGVRVTARVLQTPVGDSPQAKEPTVSDGEREEMTKVLSMARHTTRWEYAATSSCQDEDYVQADALIAAGYRKAPVVSVEDVERVVGEVMFWNDGDSAVPAIATAVLALLEGGGRG